MKKSLLWFIILLLAIAFVYFITQYDQDGTDPVVSNNMLDIPADTNNDPSDDADLDADDDTLAGEDEDNDDDITDPIEENIVAHDGYQLYAEDAVKAALSADKDVALFFHAAWCPDCRALDADLLANEAMINENTFVFRVDYDSETALKDRYVVTEQHTIVYLDKNMDAVDTVRGIFTTEEVLGAFDN